MGSEELIWEDITGVVAAGNGPYDTIFHCFFAELMFLLKCGSLCTVCPCHFSISLNVSGEYSSIPC